MLGEVSPQRRSSRIYVASRLSQLGLKINLVIVMYLLARITLNSPPGAELEINDVV
jgi:hypothetical protein